MAIENIIKDWDRGKYAPIYWLEGEEEYYIDKVVNYAEEYILTEEEASFNLTVFYGRDTNWADVINTCRKYPMFSEKQVVIIKEAQYLKGIEKLEAYIQKPLLSTILVISHKEKKLDSRTRFGKLVKEKGVFESTKKLAENKLPDWVNHLVRTLGLSITPLASTLLIEHIGNDLNRIESELDKVVLNLGKRKTITEDDIEKYVGISKEYNAFALQKAIAKKDKRNAMKIIQYFIDNPEMAPMPVLLASIYSFFGKVYMIYGSTDSRDSLASNLGVNPYFLSDYIEASRKYDLQAVQKILLLLHQYNLKSIGIHSVNLENEAILKELLVKIMY